MQYAKVSWQLSQWLNSLWGLTVAVEHDGALHDVVQVLQAVLIFKVITLLQSQAQSHASSQKNSEASCTQPTSSSMRHERCLLTDIQLDKVADIYADPQCSTMHALQVK